MQPSTRFALVFFALLAPVCLRSDAQGSKDRLSAPVSDWNTVTLRGNVHPAILSAGVQVGVVQTGLPMERMILLLQSDSTQQSALDQLIQQQHDPKSASYGKFLSPQDFGSQFGVSSSDVNKVSVWLQGHGFRIDEIPASRASIVFSGTSDQVAATFGTQIRKVLVNGQIHYANDADPHIPAALSGVVSGIVKLHNFSRHHSVTAVKPAPALNSPTAEFTYGSGHYLAPADYATIYDIKSLYSASVDGTGQSIAVVARSNIYMADVQTFRSEFGLAANNPTIIIVNSDPGVVSGDSVETTLDTEWSGAVAPKAAIKVVVASSTNTADGIDLSAQYVVNNNVAPIVSLSYGSCEADMGATELAFYNNLWKQASAQGMTVLVSSGDSGAAGCDGGSSTTGTQTGVNGLCSSPYAVCVGGTEFVEGSNPGQYWLSGNNAVMGSAQSYIPEAVWNESASNGGSGLWSGGGGASIAYAKPAWQTGPGVPADGRRDVPDVSLAAASHDGYLIEYTGGLYSVGGTSAAAPSFAGLMALVNQKATARQGNPNTNLYALAAKQTSGGSKIFNDITSGNNSVPGVAGFAAAAGYDRASGLGSVDANQLVNHWNDLTNTTPTLTLTTSPATLSIAQGGANQTVMVTVSTGGNFNSAVALTVTGAPAGVTATLNIAKTAAPGSGTSTLTVAVAKTATAGTATLTITGTGATLTSKATVQLTVMAAGTFTITPSATSASVVQGSSASLQVNAAAQNGFNSTVAFSVTGLPAGVTGAFAPATVTLSSAASSKLTLTTAKTVAAGTYPLLILATGGSVTKTVSVNLTVTAPGTFTITPSATSASIVQGSSGSVQVNAAAQSGFNSTVAFSLAGLPSGVTATFAPANVALSATASTKLTLSVASAAQAGTYSLVITATGGSATKTASMNMTVTPAGTFTISPNAASVSIGQASSIAVQINASAQYGFNSSVAFSVTGLPNGLTGAFAPPSVTLAGTASTKLMLTTGKTVPAGTYPLLIAATGGGVTKTTSVNLTVTAPIGCTLTSNPASINFVAGVSTSFQVSCGGVTGALKTALNLVVNGQPANGVVVQILQNYVVPGGGGAAFAVTSTQTAAPGTYYVSVTASLPSGGFSQTLSIPMVITAPNTILVEPAQNSVTLSAGSSTTLKVAVVNSGNFKSAVSLLVAGLPAGVTATLSPSSFAAPGNGATTVTLTASAAAKTSGYFVIEASGGGLFNGAPVGITITAAAARK